MNNNAYRYVNHDSVDQTFNQFYIKNVNNAIYIQFNYVSSRDKKWLDVIQENDIITIFQYDIEVVSAKIIETYNSDNSDNGFRLEVDPSPSLTEGSHYGIAYSRDRPSENL